MDPVSSIGIIAQVLALSGIVSIRMFLPVFLYFFMMRLAVAFPEHAPEMLLKMAERVPDWQISWPFLVIAGVLAAAEVMANRNPDVKQFLVEDFDRYAKPALSILLACSVVNTAQSEEVRQLLQMQKAGIGSFGLIMAAVACSMTAAMCRIRAAILEKLYAIDPDNSLGLQSVANYAGESFLAAVLLLLVFLPSLALLLTACGFAAGMIFRKLQNVLEKKRSHLCPECLKVQRETMVSNCAVNCPVCGAEQPEVCRVGWLGTTSTTPLGHQPLLKHAGRLLAYRRCRWCAEPLNDHTDCPVCGRRQWDDDELLKYYLRQSDLRGGALFIISLLTFFFPVAGCMLMMIFFRPLVLRPLAVHLSGASRFWVAFCTMLFKLASAVLLIMLALVPGIGIICLLPFLVRYMMVRKRFCRMVGNSRRRLAGAAD